MDNNLYEEFSYIWNGEWYLLLLGFSLILCGRQTLKACDNFARLINYLLVSLTAVISFVLEALFMFGGQIGMRGGLYVHILIAHHLLPLFLFIILIDIVIYLFARIELIIKNAYLLGKKVAHGARIALTPNISYDFILSPQRMVLLQ